MATMTAALAASTSVAYLAPVKTGVLVGGQDHGGMQTHSQFQQFRTCRVAFSKALQCSDKISPITYVSRMQSSSSICAAAYGATCVAVQSSPTTKRAESTTITKPKGEIKTPKLDFGGGNPPLDTGGGGGGGGGGGENFSGGFFLFGFFLFLSFLKDKEREVERKEIERKMYQF